MGKPEPSGREWFVPPTDEHKSLPGLCFTLCGVFSEFSLQKFQWCHSASPAGEPFPFFLQFSYWFAHKARIVHQLRCCTLTSFAYQLTLVFLFEDRLFRIKIYFIFDLMKLRWSYLQIKKVKKPNTGWLTFMDSFQDQLWVVIKCFILLFLTWPSVTCQQGSGVQVWGILCGGTSSFLILWWQEEKAQVSGWHVLLSRLRFTLLTSHFTFQVCERRNTSDPSGADF